VQVNLKGDVMSEDTTTTTEEETVQAQETEQLEISETQAVQVEETEGDTQEEEATDTPDQTSDDETLEWATKKGLKLDDPIALAKMVRESEQRMHEATKAANALKTTIDTTGAEAGFDDTSLLLNRLKVNEFYLDNPEAKSLDDEMAKIVTEKPFLADDLSTVFELAKARSVATDTVNARKSGQQEALAQVAKAQKAAPPKASATTRQSPAAVTEEAIAAMSATEYVQFKKDNPDFKPF